MSTAPTNPLPENPLPLFVEPKATLAVAPSSAPAAAQQFYLKQGESVRTLGADQIRIEVASGVVRPDALICKVGDTGWRPLSDAASIGVQLPSFKPPPAPNLAPQKTVAVEETNPFARPPRGGLGARWARVKHKGTVIAWGVSLSLGLSIVLQRNGTLHSLAEGWDLAKSYESLEKSVFGGPGEGTVRSAKRLREEVLPSALLPFSQVEERVKASRSGSVNPAP